MPYIESSTPTVIPTHKARPLGQLSLLALGVNGIVGVGIFFAPADVATFAPGSSGIVLFAATACAMLPVALAIAALGRRFDEDGGPILFARHAFGEFWAFLVGWLAYVTSAFSTAAILVGFTRSVAPMLGLHREATYQTATIGLTSALALLVAAGTALSARIWSALTVLKLVPLVALVGAALWACLGDRLPPPDTIAAAAPVPPMLWLRGALTATFAYQGFEVIPVIAGQVHASARAIPRAIIGSLAVSAALYVLLQFACVRALPDLAHSQAPLTEAATFYGGQKFSTLVSLGSGISAFGIAVGMMVMTPRYLAALSPGNRGLARVAENGVPLRALVVTWALVTTMVLLGSRAELFAMSSLAVVLQYAIAAIALIVLAKRGARGLRRKDTWAAYPTLIIAFALVVGATAHEWLAASAVLAIGLGLRSWITSSR